MLKPQIYVGVVGLGELKMPSDEEWDLFMTDYYRWIRSYGLF